MLFGTGVLELSVKQEDERMLKEQYEEEYLRTRFFQTGQRPPLSSRRVFLEKARLRARSTILLRWDR
jgi:hypothetical protein